MRDFFARPAYCGLILCLLAGCFGRSNLPGDTGTVSGRALYQGQPVPAGSAVVMVHRESGLVGVGATDSNGAFQIQMRGGPDVLVGEYVVNLTPPGKVNEDAPVLNKDTVPPDWNKVPAKYWVQTTSPERFTVNAGQNDYQFDLQD